MTWEYSSKMTPQVVVLVAWVFVTCLGVVDSDTHTEFVPEWQQSAVHTVHDVQTNAVGQKPKAAQAQFQRKSKAIAASVAKLRRTVATHQHRAQKHKQQLNNLRAKFASAEAANPIADPVADATIADTGNGVSLQEQVKRMLAKKTSREELTKMVAKLMREANNKKVDVQDKGEQGVQDKSSKSSPKAPAKQRNAGSAAEKIPWKKHVGSEHEGVVTLTRRAEDAAHALAEELTKLDLYRKAS